MHMADEIIKLLEYVINDPTIMAGAAVYAALKIAAFLITVIIFVVVFIQILRSFSNNKKRSRR